MEGRAELEDRKARRDVMWRSVEGDAQLNLAMH